jgi:hypothetical protein
MDNRSKRAKSADSNFKAMGKGERTSKKVSTIRTASGTSFRRKNANQYGAAEGGNDYTEKRVNRTDSFETGGTADSAENGGANVGGTLGSSMMKRGGGLGEEFYKGQSIIMTDKSPYYDRMNKMMKRVVSPYINKELVIDKITKSKPHNLAKVFLRSSGEKAPFDVVLNKKYIQQYGNGGGTGVSSQTGFAEGTNADLLMNQDYLAYKKGGKLIGKQKNLDMNKNGKLDSQDFKMIRGEMKHGGSVKVGDKVMLPKIKMRDGKIQFEEVENGKVLSIENGIYDVLNPKTNRIHRVTLNQIKFENGGGLADVPESFPETDAMSYGKGGGTWKVNDVSKAKHLGIIEFQDNEGEYHNFEVMETEDRLVFGGFSNSGFIESGYIEKDGFSTDEVLQELLSDLETYYNDGKEYTSMIVVNDRMAQGGSTKGFEYSIGGL